MMRKSNFTKVVVFLLLLIILVFLGLSRNKKTNEAKIAEIFYEKHYYKVLENIYGENLGRYFDEGHNSEIIVYLYNLVVYKSNDMIEILKELPCNLRKSTLVIKAKSPYGPKDYTYVIHCLDP